MSCAAERGPETDVAAIAGHIAGERPVRVSCQSFRQGCAGCCLNMQWPEEKLERFLKRNTRMAELIFPSAGQPGRFRLLLFYLACGGTLDYLLSILLLMPFTFALSVRAWRRFAGSCRFAGIIDRRAGRVGCLIHPARIGLPDCRTHAFPMLPTLNCDPEINCSMLSDGTADLSLGWFEASRRGCASM